MLTLATQSPSMSKIVEEVLQPSQTAIPKSTSAVADIRVRAQQTATESAPQSITITTSLAEQVSAQLLYVISASECESLTRELADSIFKECMLSQLVETARGVLSTISSAQLPEKHAVPTLAAMSHSEVLQVLTRTLRDVIIETVCIETLDAMSLFLQSPQQCAPEGAATVELYKGTKLAPVLSKITPHLLQQLLAQSENLETIEKEAGIISETIADSAVSEATLAMQVRQTSLTGRKGVITVAEAKLIAPIEKENVKKARTAKEIATTLTDIVLVEAILISGQTKESIVHQKIEALVTAESTESRVQTYEIPYHKGILFKGCFLIIRVFRYLNIKHVHCY